jgi:hypothetical protein
VKSFSICTLHLDLLQRLNKEGCGASDTQHTRGGAEKSVNVVGKRQEMKPL